ncbi:hypothetical protein E3I18_00895 [Candidatus Woesebacteria bacterium]|nr:MAG: hypothetical protein E3I18_00895 [Candidatus Woesebacteria bacterium]
MKKIISILTIVLSLLILPVVVFAQREQQSAGQQQVAENRGIETAIQSLNRVTERDNNPEVGEQIRSMVQNHERVQIRTETALHQMSQRNQVLRFFIGPDYKNAGQVRSDVVSLRNNIRELEQIKEESLPTDAEDIQGAIDELQIEADELEVQLTEQLSGFSLFGWLARLLVN